MAWERKKRKMRLSAVSQFSERTYPDVMVDLETLGTDVDCQVLSIGAVRFRMGNLDDVDTIMEPKRSFYARLSLEDQEDRHIDDSTMEWWSQQSDEARAVFDEEELDVESTLKAFTKFCKGAKRIWGNGNMFDNAIMRDLYEDFNQEYPFDYWKDLDVRTVTYLWNLLTDWKSKGKRPTIVLGEEHNALDDARRQVLQVQTMIKQLRGSKYES